MKFKVLVLVFMSVAVLGFASTLSAQHAGFAVAIRPVVNSPVQPFVNAPVQPLFGNFPPRANANFGVMPPIVPPIITTSYPGIYFPQPNSFGPGQQVPVYFGPNRIQGYAGTTIIVPNGTVITNSTVIIQQPPAQAVVVGPNQTSFAPARPTVSTIPAGTGRAEVLQQLGSPLTGVYSQGTETLYFSGGITVVIQNGKVVRPN
jgi:hypothetical protein